MPVHLTCSTCGKALIRSPSKVRTATPYCSIDCQFPRPAPIISADGTTAAVPLHARDGELRGHATIDAADAAWASQWRWHLTPNGYAARNGDPESATGRAIYLHRELLGLTYGDGLEGDHIDRDTLNDRRGNLRVATHAQNVQNVTVRRKATSAYRGVSWNSERGRWAASVTVRSKMHQLGYFDDEVEAAEAARAGRERLMTHATD